MSKKISIVIPVYNVGNSIRHTLDSLRFQDTNYFEILIVDDGSTDNTSEVINTYILENSHIEIKVFKQENQGVSCARNKGIKESNCDYIFFLDGDDYVSQGFIESVVEKLELNPDILTWGYHKVNQNGEVLWKFEDEYILSGFRKPGIEVLRNIIINENFSIWTCSAIYKRDLLINNSIKFTEKCSAGEDLEFIYKALCISDTVININSILTFYVQRVGSTINSFNIKRFDSVLAMIRAATYIEGNSEGNDKDIVLKIREEEAIKHYIYSFIAYYKYCAFPKKREICNMVEIQYPGMNKIIKSKITNLTNTSVKNKIKYRLFLFCPRGYFIITNIF